MRAYSILISVILLAITNPAPSFAQQIINRDDAGRAATWCAARNVTGTLEQFAICTAGAISDAELRRCAQGRSCFGINFDDILRFGGCGGRNSVARRVLGDSICGGDLCQGNVSVVRYYNKTNRDIRPRIKGQCDSREDRGTSPPGYWMEWRDTGESHFWAWSGGVSKPRDRCGSGGREARSYTRVTGGKYGEDPRAGKWKLLTGRVYEFRNMSGCVVPFDITPVFQR